MENNVIDTRKSKAKSSYGLSYRLPSCIHPRIYELRVEPHWSTKTFKGTVNIIFRLMQPLLYIPLHVNELNVSTEEALRLTPTGAHVLHNVPFVKTYESVKFQLWVTEFAQPLVVGTYSIRLTFNGSLQNSSSGFYKSVYRDYTSQKPKWLAGTQLSPINARKVFPCFDEPDMKAQFAITLLLPIDDSYQALSNMSIKKVRNLGKLSEVTFENSLPMSTYLVSFIVTDFPYKSLIVRPKLECAFDIKIRLYCRQTKIHMVKFALRAAASLIEFFGDFFQMSYPLSKLDIVVIPNFNIGAMENWGLITLKDTSIFFDDKMDAGFGQRYVGLVLAHSLAQMWIGNLVTPKWWNSTWLYKGLATYMEYKAVGSVYPELQFYNEILVDQVQEAMRVDATLSSYAIEHTIITPDEIRHTDVFSLRKGTAIVRMLKDLVGDDNFKTGINKYFNKFKYSNADTDDFLNAMKPTDQCKANLFSSEIFKTFIEQMGFPVIMVKETGGKYVITQKRFLSNSSKCDDMRRLTVESKYNYRWSVPLTYVTDKDPDVKRVVFNYKDKEVIVEPPKYVSWIKFNKDQVGYYCVNYDIENWHSLSHVLMSAHKTFSVCDRTGLLNDAFSLANAGQLKYCVALDLTLYLQYEMNHVPWAVAIQHFYYLSRYFFYSEYYIRLVYFIRYLLKRPYSAVSWRATDNLALNFLRIYILQGACKYKYFPAMKEVSKYFRSWLEDTEQRPAAESRAIIYSYGMEMVGDEKSWNQVWNLYVCETDKDEKKLLLKCLASIRDPYMLHRLIKLIYHDRNVNRQEFFYCLHFIASNSAGTPVVWYFIRDSYFKIMVRFTMIEPLLDQLFQLVTSRFATITKLEEVLYFFAKFPVTGPAIKSRQSVLARIRQNIEWLKKNKQNVGEWLAMNVYERVF